MSEYRTYTLHCDFKPDIRFTGRLIADVDSEDNHELKRTILKLYETKSGKYVCERLVLSNLDGTVLKEEASVAEDSKGVKDFFAWGYLSKELYDLAGFESWEVVE